MYELIETTSKIVVLEATYRLNGETVPRLGGDVVGKVIADCLTQAFGMWRATPGAFGPTCATAKITPRTGPEFVAGGNVLTLMAMAQDRYARLEWIDCYVDRNAARAAAETMGGVAV
jgi:hypothetical protein